MGGAGYAINGGGLEVGGGGDVRGWPHCCCCYSRRSSGIGGGSHLFVVWVFGVHVRVERHPCSWRNRSIFSAGMLGIDFYGSCQSDNAL